MKNEDEFLNADLKEVETGISVLSSFLDRYKFRTDLELWRDLLKKLEKRRDFLLQEKVMSNDEN